MPVPIASLTLKSIIEASLPSLGVVSSTLGPLVSRPWACLSRLLVIRFVDICKCVATSAYCVQRKGNGPSYIGRVGDGMAPLTPGIPGDIGSSDAAYGFGYRNDTIGLAIPNIYAFSPP
jgi:hypothetical protein